MKYMHVSIWFCMLDWVFRLFDALCCFCSRLRRSYHIHINDEFIDFELWCNQSHMCSFCSLAFLLTNPTSIIQIHNNREKLKKKKKKKEALCIDFRISESVLLISDLISLREHHLQPILHVHCQCKFWNHREVLSHLHAVAVEDRGGGKFHLVISKILPQA